MSIEQIISLILLFFILIPAFIVGFIFLSKEEKRNKNRKDKKFNELLDILKRMEEKM